MEKNLNTDQSNFVDEATSQWTQDINPNEDQHQADLAIVPTSNSSIAPNREQSRILTATERRQILEELAVEYQKLVRNLANHLPARSRSGVRLAVATTQLLAKYGYLEKPPEDLQGLQQLSSGESIGFVELFRQHIYYKRLGIPLTILDLIYMGDTKREGQSNAMPSRVIHRDNCTQTDSDGRLRGGCNLPIGHSLAAAPSTVRFASSDDSCDCGDCVRGRELESIQLLQRSGLNNSVGSNSGNKYYSTDYYVDSCLCCRAAEQRISDMLELPSAPPPPPPPPPMRPPPATPTPTTPPPPPPPLPTMSSHHLSHRGHSEIWSLNYMKSLPELDLDDSSDLSLHRTPKVVNLPSQVEAQCRNRDLIMEQSSSSDDTISKPIDSSDGESQSESDSYKTFSLYSLSNERFDILSVVWYNPRAFDEPPAVSTGRGIPEYNPINMFHSGHKGTPILDADAAQLALDQSDYFARRFDQLSVEEKGYDIALRLRQLRIFQDQLSYKYCQKLKAKKPRPERQLSATRMSKIHHECPMHKMGCPRLMGESLLAHFLNAHFDEPGIEVSEISELDKVLIKFKPETFEISRNICLSMIVHTGFKNITWESSFKNGIPFYNTDLPESYAKYSDHMPIFVMACRTRVKKDLNKESMLSPRARQLNGSFTCDSLYGTSSGTTMNSSRTEAISLQDSCGEESEETVMALWLVSVDLPHPIYVHVALFNQRLNVCRTSIMQIRRFSSTQKADKFIPKSKNYMRLNEQDLRMLSNNHQEPIYLDIAISHFNFAKNTATNLRI